MKPLVIGTREQVAGFALAGVAGVVCETPEEIAKAIARADAESLVIRFAGPLEAGGRSSPEGPLVVVLPASS